MSSTKINNLAPVTSIALRRDVLHVIALPKSDSLQALMRDHFACVSYDKTPDWRSMPETDPPGDD